MGIQGLTRVAIAAVIVGSLTAPVASAMTDARDAPPPRVAVWQGAMAGPQGIAPDATIRQLVMVSSDASSIRVRFSNHFGATPLLPGAVDAGAFDVGAGAW